MIQRLANNEMETVAAYCNTILEFERKDWVKPRLPCHNIISPDPNIVSSEYEAVVLAATAMVMWCHVKYHPITRESEGEISVEWKTATNIKLGSGGRKKKLSLFSTKILHPAITLLRFKFEVFILYSFKYNQQDTLHNILYYCQCSTCFGRFLRPSSGAQELYTQHLVCARLACCYR